MIILLHAHRFANVRNASPAPTEYPIPVQPLRPFAPSVLELAPDYDPVFPGALQRPHAECSNRIEDPHTLQQSMQIKKVSEQPIIKDVLSDFSIEPLPDSDPIFSRALDGNSKHTLSCSLGCRFKNDVKEHTDCWVA